MMVLRAYAWGCYLHIYLYRFFSGPTHKDVDIQFHASHI